MKTVILLSCAALAVNELYLIHLGAGSTLIAFMASACVALLASMWRDTP